MQNSRNQGFLFLSFFFFSYDIEKKKKIFLKFKKLLHNRNLITSFPNHHFEVEMLNFSSFLIPFLLLLENVLKFKKLHTRHMVTSFQNHHFEAKMQKFSSYSENESKWTENILTNEAKALYQQESNEKWVSIFFSFLFFS